MKIFCYILSLYFMTLTGVACADDYLHEECSNATEIANTGHDDHAHGQASGDECSPFCSCHCCHVHVVLSGTDLFFILEELPVHPADLPQHPYEADLTHFPKPPQHTSIRVG